MANIFNFKAAENFCKAKRRHFVLKKISVRQNDFISGYRKFLRGKTAPFQVAENFYRAKWLQFGLQKISAA
ncbi:MAG: hypothetical protein WCK78_11075 [Paludibacter sp.]